MSLIANWLLSAKKLSLAVSGSTNEIADHNLLIFNLENAKKELLEIELAEFVTKLSDIYYSKSLAKNSFGLFYAWHDEMSGTLRSSYTPDTNPKNLPFRCQLQLSNDPNLLAKIALKSPHNEGIPFSELTPVPFDEDELNDNDEYVLILYVREFFSNKT